MEAHELAEKFKNTKRTVAGFQEIISWCEKNAQSINLADEDQRYLYEMSTRYLMKMKIGHWTKEDANVVINYFAKSYANIHGIDKDVIVTIMEYPEYRERFHDNSSAICVSNDTSKSEVVYSSKVVDNLMSNDKLKFIRGLQTVFHEVVHAIQHNEIYNLDSKEAHYNGNTYKIALETITKKALPKFYDENYFNLMKEYQAEYFGLQQAMQMMETYCKADLLQGKNIDDFLNIMLRLSGKTSYENTNQINFQQRNISASAAISFAVGRYIEAKPEMINVIPILKFAYNSDGSKKSIVQLIEERDNLISSLEQANLQDVDDLYRTIVNYGPTTKAELDNLFEYIEKTGTSDEFVFDLLQLRLQKTSMSLEKISQLMQVARDTATIVRAEREEKEISYEEQESIKDETGDDLKPMPKRQQQEEQKTEEMWQNRFQTWDQDSLNISNSAKRKEDAIKEIQKANERQRTQQRRKQVQIEQDDYPNI